MTEIIYICDDGHVFGPPVGGYKEPAFCPHSNHGDALNAPLIEPVRIFHEEDVRPLWDALVHIGRAASDRLPATLGEASAHAQSAAYSFPAPEEWRS